MAEPRSPTREELKQFLPSHDLIRKFERLFGMVSDEIPETLQAVAISAGNAGASGVAALSGLESASQQAAIDSGNAYALAAQAVAELRRMADNLEYLALAPLVAIGSMAQQQANAVRITGGNITGITDLAIADGGTGASSAAGARTNLGLGTMATQNSNLVSITGGDVTANLINNQTILLQTAATLTDGAGANTATMDNSPTAGDPTKWVAINDNGTTRYIPAW